MSYVLGKYEFETLQEYERGRRDASIIMSLDKVGNSYGEIIEHYRQQLLDKNVRFESQVGYDFLDEIHYKPPVEAVVSAPKRTIEAEVRLVAPDLVRILLVSLITMLAMVITFLSIQIKGSVDGKKQIEKLRENLTALTAEAVVEEEAVGVEQERGEEAILTKFQGIYANNSDFVGWLTIPGTKIDYPVMYVAGDNDYYLKHNFQKEEDANGLLVLDKRCEPTGDERNTLIHGHNLKSGNMFGELRKYADKDFLKNHQEIQYSTLYEDKVYDVYAVFTSTVYEEDTSEFNYYDFINITDEKQFIEYVAEIKLNALYLTGADIQYGDNLITLSTCEYSKENGRLVVVGRERRK